MKRKFSNKKQLKNRSYGEVIDVCIEILGDIKKERLATSLFSLAFIGSISSTLITSAVLTFKGKQLPAYNNSHILETIFGTLGATTFITKMSLGLKESLLIGEVKHDLKNYGVWFKEANRSYPPLYLYSEDNSYRVDVLDIINEASLIAINNKRTLMNLNINQLGKLKEKMIEETERPPIYEIYEEFKPKKKVQNSGIEK